MIILKNRFPYVTDMGSLKKVFDPTPFGYPMIRFNPRLLIHYQHLSLSNHSVLSKTQWSIFQKAGRQPARIYLQLWWNCTTQFETRYARFQMVKKVKNQFKVLMHPDFSMKLILEILVWNPNLGSDLILVPKLVLDSDSILVSNLILGSDLISGSHLFWKGDSQFNSTLGSEMKRSLAKFIINIQCWT